MISQRLNVMLVALCFFIATSLPVQAREAISGGTYNQSLVGVQGEEKPGWMERFKRTTALKKAIVLSTAILLTGGGAWWMLRDSGQKSQMPSNDTQLGRHGDGTDPTVPTRFTQPELSDDDTTLTEPMSDDSDETVTMGDEEKIQIFVRAEGGLHTDIWAKPSETIRDVKQRMFFKRGFIADQQRYRLGGKVLTDEQTLKDAGVTKETTIHLNLRVPTTPITEEERASWEHALRKRTPAQLKELEKRRRKQAAWQLEQRQKKAIPREEIQFWVMTGGGVRTDIWAKPSATIGEVKKMVEAIRSYPPDQQRYRFGGRVLTDEMTLKDAGVTKEKTIDLDLRMPNITINVERPDSKIIPVSVPQYATILQIKEAVRDINEMDPNFQRLFVNGTELKNDEKLSDRGIKDGGTIKLRFTFD